MIFDDSFWQYGLLLSNALLIAAAGIAVIRIRSEMRAARAFWSSPAVSAMQPEPYDDRDLRRMVDRRITMLEKYLEHQIESRAADVPEPAVLAPHKSEMPVEYAVRMARAGASADDLVRGCGLNKGEAELLMRLHANHKKPTQQLTH
jgi:Protein of unknown function (DUF2802)